MRADVFQLDLRSHFGKPGGPFLFVRVAAELLFVGENREKARMTPGEFLDLGAELGKQANYREAGFFVDSRLIWRHSHAVPSFLLRIFGREEENLGQSFLVALCGVLSAFREDQQGGALLVVPGQVVEILFLFKHVGLRGLFAAGEAKENYRCIHLGRELSAAVGIDAVRLAVAAFLGTRRRSDAGNAKTYRGRNRGLGGIERQARPPARIAHHFTSLTYCWRPPFVNPRFYRNLLRSSQRIQGHSSWKTSFGS